MEATALQILDDLFRACSSNPEGTDSKRFRIDHEDQLETIDELVRYGYIERTGEFYTLRLPGLLRVASQNAKAKSIVDDGDSVYDALREFYKAEPMTPVDLNDLGELAGIDRVHLNEVVRYMDQAGIFQFRSKGFPDQEEASAAPSEDVLVYKTYQAALNKVEELQERIETRTNPLPVSEIQTPGSMFDGAHDFSNLLHECVVRGSLQLFNNGHYRESVVNSMLAVFGKIKEMTGLDLDGSRLINTALSSKDPYIILSNLDSDSGHMDQNGFMELYRGAYLGIRNPISHNLEYEIDKMKAARYLVFASLLAQRLDESQVVKTVHNDK